MFHKLLIALATIMLMISQKAIAQNKEVSRKYFNQIKWAPLRSVDFHNQGIEFAVERSFGNKLATEIGWAGFFNILISGRTKSVGNKFSIIEKYFFYHFPFHSSDWYIYSAWSNISYQTAGVFYTDSLRVNEYLDYFGVDKRVYSFNTRGGFQIVKSHFVFDVNIGLGARHRIATRNNIDHPGNPQKPGWTNRTDRDGNIWTVNIPLGVKLGFCF